MTRKRKKQQKKGHRIQPITAPGCDWVERNKKLHREVSKLLHELPEDEIRKRLNRMRKDPGDSP